MKKTIKNVSPFLLLTLPFFVALILMAIHAGSEMLIEKIRLSASFFSLPELRVFRAFFLQ